MPTTVTLKVFGAVKAVEVRAKFWAPLVWVYPAKTMEEARAGATVTLIANPDSTMLASLIMGSEVCSDSSVPDFKESYR